MTDLVNLEVENPNPLARGYVDRLIVENFKSYAGRHEIGPLKRFSCIIGPNGSGKSNLMDALSFVLGIQAKHLRGERLIDLVYRREEESLADIDRTALVMLVLAMPGETDERMHVGRVINSKGESNYKFAMANMNSKVKLKNIDYEALQNELKKINIFVRARNFLVFQGDVMDLARRQGTELTKIIETISGSDQLKNEMDRLNRERAIADEKQRVFFSEKRKTEQQKTELERQKTDVETYNKLKEKIKRDNLIRVLVGMHQHDVNITKAKKELEKAKEVVSEKMKVYEEKQKTAIEAEKMRKKVNVQMTNLEETMRKLQTEVSDKHEEKDTMRKQQHQAAKGMKEATEKCDALIAMIDKRKSLLESSKADNEEGKQVVLMLETEIKDLEKDLLTKEQRQIWNAAEAKADKRNREKKRDWDKKLEILEELRAEEADVKKQKDELMRRTEELERKKINVEKSFTEQGKRSEGAKETLAKDERLIQQLYEDEEKLKEFRRTVTEEKVKAEEKLQHIRANQEHSNHHRQRQDIVNDLRSEFHGVIERVSELIVPTSMNNSMALNTALQGASHHVVCSTAKTARDCVAYLKKNKREPVTFLPLDSIKTNIEKRLPQLCRKNGRKLASNICKMNDRFYQSAAGEQWQDQKDKITDIIIGSSMGECVVCEDLDDARTIAYDESKKQGIRVRVVTMQGDMIRMNGNMVSADGSKVSFGQKTGEQEERRQVLAVKEINRDLESTNEEITKLAYKLKQTKERIKENEEHLKATESFSAQEELEKIETDLSYCHKELERVDGSLNTNTDKRADAEQAVRDAELAYQESSRDIFADIEKQFATELGVTDLRQKMLDRDKEKKKKKKEKADIQDQVNTGQAECMRLKSQLASDERQLKQINEDKMYKEKQFNTIQSKSDRFESEMKELEDRLTEKQKSNVDSRLEFERCENRQKEARTEFQKAKNEYALAQQQERKSNKVRPEVHSKYQKMLNANLEGIQIPVTECPDEYKDSSGEFLSTSVFDTEREKDELESFVTKCKLDYSVIPPELIELLEIGTDEEKSQITINLKRDIDEGQKEIDRLPASLNMQAHDDYLLLCSQFQDQTDEAEKMVKISQELTRQYEKVKDERYEKYMKCFREIEKHVDPIYKELTSFDGREGGSAFLDPESLDEPYANGTSFTACPPGKRFFDMSLLSGGEKSMASMALLMAMHSYNPPPFMILDEVDAPFDSKNTRSLVKFLKKMPFQSIVISLKDKFFCHADACVGVFKDKRMQSSGTLTADLTDYGDEEV